MQTLSGFFQPFKVLSKKNILFLIIAEAVIALLIWQLAGGELIPKPSKIAASVSRLLQNKDFYDNLFSSLSLTMRGMLISIIIALLISYLSRIPFFRPIANFIIKCRYLTLTGLSFVFILLSKDGSDLKTNLLIFGIVPFFVTSLLSVFDSINIQEYELCKTLRMSNWKALWEVVILGRLDQVFEVMRQNFAISWMMITMVEGMSMSQGGLGTMLIKSNKYIDLPTVFGLLFIILMLGIFFDYILGRMRVWLFPYAKIQTIDK
jgi:ABC-type nitrate/sulfonate/bicarbonate transport system permease component